MPNSLDGIQINKNQLNAARPRMRQPSDNPQDRLEKACKDFESIFVSHMMQQMRKTIPEYGLFEKSQAQEIYTGMLDNEVAKSVSNGRGLGLAKAMYEQLSIFNSDHETKK